MKKYITFTLLILSLIYIGYLKLNIDVIESIDVSLESHIFDFVVTAFAVFVGGLITVLISRGIYKDETRNNLIMFKVEKMEKYLCDLYKIIDEFEYYFGDKDKGKALDYLIEVGDLSLLLGTVLLKVITFIDGETHSDKAYHLSIVEIINEFDKDPDNCMKLVEEYYKHFEKRLNDTDDYISEKIYGLIDKLNIKI